MPTRISAWTSAFFSRRPLGPRAAWRSLVVQFGSTAGPSAAAESAAADEGAPGDGGPRQGRNYLWADLMRRTMGLDVVTCPRCGGRLRLIAVIDDPAVVKRILRHLGFPTEIPEARPARVPPTEVAPDLFFADDHA